MTSTEKIAILSELEIFLQELEEYRSYRLWKAIKRVPTRKIVSIDNLRNKLLRDVGRFRLLITELSGKEEIKIAERGDLYSSDIWIRSLRLEFDPVTSNLLDYCIDVTNVAIGKLEDDIKKGYRDKQGNPIEKTHQVDTEPPKAFIAHGGKSGVLNKLREFVEALGIKPIIVELSPTKGMSVDDKVNKYIKDADCGIILATKGGIIDTKGKETKQHPRLNVTDELERLRAAFPNKTILLLEKGVDLPSNISGLTHEPFVGQSMDRAFTAIARELVEFGILRATKPQE